MPEGKTFSLGLIASLAALAMTSLPAAAQQQKRPNVVMLMTDDTGWNDFGAYSGGGAALGHATPNIDRIAKEGATFTSWYGQASCTAGRSSFMTGRIPIRTALSIVVAPGDENALKKETPTIAEFFKKNGYSTYFSGKWHLGDKPDSYPIEHGFDEMRAFAAYYPGVYTYADTSKWFHPWFPSYNPQFSKEYFGCEHVRMGGSCRATSEAERDHHLRTPCRVRRSPNRLRDRLHQKTRQGFQALLHERELHEDAQPD